MVYNIIYEIIVKGCDSVVVFSNYRGNMCFTVDENNAKMNNMKIKIPHNPNSQR